jgi:hypothetical protein
MRECLAMVSVLLNLVSCLVSVENSPTAYRWFFALNSNCVLFHYEPEGRGFETRWGEILNLPNPSGCTRPWGLLSI